jgi:hypothetical protein
MRGVLDEASKEEGRRTMANYLLLIYRDESAAEQAGGTDVSTPYRRFMERRGAALRGGAALQPAESATSVRSDGSGGFAITDGPFAESKEALGGYYVIDAADLDEALAIAKDVPAPFGGVEVRPIRVLS